MLKQKHGCVIFVNLIKLCYDTTVVINMNEPQKDGQVFVGSCR